MRSTGSIARAILIDFSVSQEIQSADRRFSILFETGLRTRSDVPFATVATSSRLPLPTSRFSFELPCSPSGLNLCEVDDAIAWVGQTANLGFRWHLMQ